MPPRLKKVFYISAGSISLTLGAVGIFLPVLPTTPFLLLSSYCFLRSSKKMHHWLTHHKVFGNYISNYIEHQAIKKSDRTKALIFLWLSLIFAMTVSMNLHLTLFLILIGSGVTIHLFMLKSIE